MDLRGESRLVILRAGREDMNTFLNDLSSRRALRGEIIKDAINKIK